MVVGGGLACLLVFLAGCGGGAETDRRIASVLMGPASDEEVEMEGRRPEPPGGPRCPPVTLREGTESMRVYERGREGDPRAVRYQGAVRELVRECEFDADEAGVRVRLGVSGRLVTGAAGGPGNYELPIRVVAMRPGGEPVWTQLYRVPVTVEPGRSNVRFRQVIDDIRLEVGPGEGFEQYVIFAGFDELS